jgi:hypothetical protein
MLAFTRQKSQVVGLPTSLWPPSASTDIGSALTGYYLQAYVQRFSSLLP